MFHEDVNNDYVEYFIMDLYKNIVNLAGLEDQAQEYNYTVENIREEIGMLDFLCRCRALTEAESEIVDLAIEELKGTDLKIKREDDKWKGNLKNWASYLK